MSSQKKEMSLWHPRHWLMWLGIAIFRLLVLFPWKVQFHIGRLLGSVFFYAVRIRRNVVAVNLKLCFPEKSPVELKALSLAHYHSLGIGLMETCMAWWGNTTNLPKYEILGKQHLAAASDRGKGVILFTAHFTTLEICGRILNEHFPIGCLYRDPDDKVVAAQMRAARTKDMTAVIDMFDLRGFIRALKAGHTIWYASDQGKRTAFSVILPFFGVPALSNTAASKLATMTGAAVVPYFGKRKNDGSYVLTILPALKDFPTENPQADTIRTNQLIEDSVRQAPEQYFWIHRRFKRRGTEYEDIYRS